MQSIPVDPFVQIYSVLHISIQKHCGMIVFRQGVNAIHKNGFHIGQASFHVYHAANQWTSYNTTHTQNAFADKCFKEDDDCTT